MPLDLKSTRVTYSLHDPPEADSGYKFTVDAEQDPEWGWQASVIISTHGFKTADAAIEHLRHAAKAFLRQIQETYGDKK